MEILSLDIEFVVKSVSETLSSLRVTYKNELGSFSGGNDLVTPDEKDVGPWDLIEDETDDEIYNCQLTFPKDRKEDVVRSLTSVFGEPTEVRKNDPVWKYGREGSGQLWVYDYGDDRCFIDVRYYYEKV